jgi:hypothetical protein
MIQKVFSRSIVPSLLAGVLGLSAPAKADGPFQFYTVSPCRVVDTRDPSGPTAGSPLADQTVQTFAIQGECGVPVGARAVTINVTAVAPTAQGHLRIFPSDIAVPTVSTLNFAAGESALANGAILPLADQRVEPEDLAIFPRVVGSGTVHVIIDVTGYFQ